LQARPRPSPRAPLLQAPRLRRELAHRAIKIRCIACVRVCVCVCARERKKGRQRDREKSMREWGCRLRGLVPARTKKKKKRGTPLTCEPRRLDSASKAHQHKRPAGPARQLALRWGGEARLGATRWIRAPPRPCVPCPERPVAGAHLPALHVSDMAVAHDAQGIPAVAARHAPGWECCDQLRAREARPRRRRDQLTPPRRERSIRTGKGGHVVPFSTGRAPQIASRDSQRACAR
jgi:hypothetical protein